MATGPRLLFGPYPVKVLLRADEERAVGHGVGGEGLLTKVVLGELLEGLARLEHGADAGLVLEPDFPVGENGGGRVVAGDAFGPVDLAGLRVEAARDARVGDDVEFVADEQW